MLFLTGCGVSPFMDSTPVEAPEGVYEQVTVDVVEIPAHAEFPDIWETIMAFDGLPANVEMAAVQTVPQLLEICNALNNTTTGVKAFRERFSPDLEQAAFNLHEARSVEPVDAPDVGNVNWRADYTEQETFNALSLGITFVRNHRECSDEETMIKAGESIVKQFGFIKCPDVYGYWLIDLGDGTSLKMTFNGSRIHFQLLIHNVLSDFVQ